MNLGPSKGISFYKGMGCFGPLEFAHVLVILST